MNRLGVGIIVSSIAAAGCLLFLIVLTYLWIIGWIDFGLISSQAWAVIILFTAIMFLGSVIFGAILFIDSNKRDWNISFQKGLFQRVLFATFPIGNLIYYSRVVTGSDKKRLSSLARGISCRKRIFLDTLALGTIFLVTATLLSFTATLCSPILFDPFPTKMLSLVKLSFGFLIATMIFFECFHVMVVLNLTEKTLTTPDKIPANLTYFPDPFRPGRGAFACYFKFLRKELSRDKKKP